MKKLFWLILILISGSGMDKIHVFKSSNRDAWVIPIGTVYAAEYQQITQDYVDTMVARALYFFSAAEERGNDDKAIEEALSKAKGIATKLRKQAQGDPNARYVMAKVTELEGQLYLWEKGLLDQKANRSQMLINVYVNEFNAGIAAQYPECQRIDSVVARVGALNNAKGSELAALFLERRKNVAKAVLFYFDESIEKKDYAKARTLLAYATREYILLGISQTQCARMAGKVNASVSVGEEIAFVKSSNEKAEKLIAQKMLTEALSVLKVAHDRLDLLRTSMIGQEWPKLSSQVTKWESLVAHCEDSLVLAVQKTIKIKGVGAASEQSDTITVHWQLTRPTISRIQEAIMTVAVASREKTSDDVAADIASLAATDAMGLHDMLATAKMRAQGRSATVQKTQLGSITQTEEVRRANMSVTAEGIRKRAQERIALNKKRAADDLVEIYSLLEEHKNAQAISLYQDKIDFLKANLDAVTIDSLTLRIKKK